MTLDKLYLFMAFNTNLINATYDIALVATLGFSLCSPFSLQASFNEDPPNPWGVSWD